MKEIKSFSSIAILILRQPHERADSFTYIIKGVTAYLKSRRSLNFSKFHIY